MARSISNAVISGMAIEGDARACTEVDFSNDEDSIVICDLRRELLRRRSALPNASRERDNALPSFSM